jgi:hypothetical protein
MRSSDVCVIAPLHAARCTISHTRPDCVAGERGRGEGRENVCVGSSLTRLVLFARPYPACAYMHWQMHLQIHMHMLLMLIFMLLLMLFCIYLYRAYAQPSIANMAQPIPTPIQCQICVVYQVKVPADPSLTPLESDFGSVQIAD